MGIISSVTLQRLIYLNDSVLLEFNRIIVKVYKKGICMNGGTLSPMRQISLLVNIIPVAHVPFCVDNIVINISDGVHDPDHDDRKCICPVELEGTYSQHVDTAIGDRRKRVIESGVRIHLD